MTLFLWRVTAVVAWLVLCGAFIKFWQWRCWQQATAEGIEEAAHREWMADLGSDDDEPVPYTPVDRVHRFAADRAVVVTDWDSELRRLTGDGTR